MTLKRARAYARKWLKRLGLGDWDVTLRFVHADDFDQSPTLGECRRCYNKKTAQIVLRRPGNQGRDDWPSGSIKLTIIYFVLHLHTTPFEPGPDTLEMKQLEQVVHQLSVALLKLERDRR